MLTNLIMRGGAVKGEEWVAGHFISAIMRLPSGTVLSPPETLSLTHTLTHSFVFHLEEGPFLTCHGQIRFHD